MEVYNSKSTDQHQQKQNINDECKTNFIQFSMHHVRERETVHFTVCLFVFFVFCSNVIFPQNKLKFTANESEHAMPPSDGANERKRAREIVTLLFAYFTATAEEAKYNKLKRHDNDDDDDVNKRGTFSFRTMATKSTRSWSGASCLRIVCQCSAHQCAVALLALED